MANRLPRQSQTQGTAGRLQVNQEHTVGTATPVLYQTLNSVLVYYPGYPLLFSTVSSNEPALRQYFANRTASGGGPVERVAKLYWSTYVVYFHNHEDAVNVVCRDNHVLNDIPLPVFLYDEQSGSVYSGRHTVTTQDPRKRSVHAVDVPVVDREASTTVLVTNICPFVSDDALKSAIDTLDKGRRPVQNIKRLRKGGIAFVQFQHHEDAITVAGMKQVSVSGCLGRRTVNLFLYRGPLPGHTDRPHRTEISIADQHGTDTAPGAPPTFHHDAQPRDAHCVSVELQPPVVPSKADTPAKHLKVGDQRTQAGCGAQSHAMYDGQTARIQLLEQAELGRIEAKMKADMKAETEAEMKAKITAERKAHFQAGLTRFQTQMGNNHLHTRLQQEVQIRSELTEERTQPAAAGASCSSNSSRRISISQGHCLTTEITRSPSPAVSLSESESDVDEFYDCVEEVMNSSPELTIQNLSGKMETEIHGLKTELIRIHARTENRLQTLESEFSQNRTDVKQLVEENRRLKSEIKQMQKQQKSDASQTEARLKKQLLETCKERDDMHIQMLAKTQAQTRTEIVTLMGEMQTLKFQMNQAQNQPCSRASVGSGGILIHAHSHSVRQHDPDREETESVITVVNPSASMSSELSSHT